MPLAGTVVTKLPFAAPGGLRGLRLALKHARRCCTVAATISCSLGHFLDRSEHARMSPAGFLVSARARPCKAALVLTLTLAALAAACSKQQADTPEQHLAKANLALDNDQRIEAEKEYREVLRLAPSDAVAQRQLGIVYFEQGQFPQAIPLLKRAADAEPNNLDLQIKLVRTYLSARQFQPARDLAQQIIEKQPAQDEAVILLASAGVGLNDIDETRKLLDNVRPEDKQRAGYHVAQGMLLFAQKDEAGAENEFNAALKADPKLGAAHAALATLFWVRKDLKRAEEELKTAAGLAPKRSPIRLQLPDFLIKTGALPEAKKILEQISNDVPDYLPARVFLMRIACAEKQDDNCAARVKAILAQDPTNFDALLQDGSLKLASGDVATAARVFEFLNSDYSQNPLVRYQLARANLLQSKVANPVESRQALDRAESNLTEAVKLDPKFAPAILALSELKIRKGTPATAVDYLLSLVKEEPQSAQAQYLLASAYVGQQNGAEALAVYRRMTELFPKDPQPSFLTGLVLLAQGQQADARKALEKSTEISPDYLPATEKLIDLDIVDQQFATAMNRIQKQFEKNPNSAQALAVRAKVFVAQKDFAHAEADLLKSIELNPKLEPSYLLLVRIYVATNRQQQAIEKLNAFAKDNNDVPSLMQLAIIQQNLKHFAEARDAYEKLIGFAPNFSPALNNLAVIYAEQFGELDKAYDLARRARDAAPADPHAADTLGWIMFKKGDYRNALTLLQESAAKLADEPDIQYHLSMVHYMLGDEDASRTALQQALQTSSDFPQRGEARQRLAILTMDMQKPTDEARAQLESFLRQQPKDPAALARLAELHRRNGAIDQAIETYQKVIDAAPFFAPAIRDLAILYAQRPDDESKAYDLATKARQAYPRDPELAKALGILNFRRGFYPQSLDLLNQAAATRNQDAEVQFYLGKTYQELKKWDECKAALGRAVAFHLSPKFSDDAHSRLANCTDMSAQ
jgi:tetratricopeptide (TPR) repeat protein